MLLSVLSEVGVLRLCSYVEKNTFGCEVHPFCNSSRVGRGSCLLLINIMQSNKTIKYKINESIQTVEKNKIKIGNRYFT